MPPIVFLFLCTLLISSCTRDPAHEEPPLELPKTNLSPDDRYLNPDSDPALLIGVDASADSLTVQDLLLLVEKLQYSGGNYLRIHPTYTDSTRLRSGLRAAMDHGLVVDTSTAAPLVAVHRSLAGFNRELLSGNGRVGLESFSQAALNGIRAVRTIERTLPFTTLRADPSVLGAENPTNATAARDSAGNYLIYMPTDGQVTVQLPDSSRQPSRRVTVVGYLGTRRSEILRPPYDRTFTLRSNEARGGWMLIERLDE